MCVLLQISEPIGCSLQFERTRNSRTNSSADASESAEYGPVYCRLQTADCRQSADDLQSSCVLKTCVALLIGTQTCDRTPACRMTFWRRLSLSFLTSTILTNSRRQFFTVRFTALNPWEGTSFQVTVYINEFSCHISVGDSCKSRSYRF